MPHTLLEKILYYDSFNLICPFKSLQDLEALRCECAEQTQQTLGLQLVVRQIVMILFNHLAEVRRLQEKAPPTPPSTTATGTTTPSSARDASLTFLNDLLRVLLCDPTVRSALSSDGVVGSTGASTATPAASVAKRPSSLRRKSCSNVSTHVCLDSGE